MKYLNIVFLLLIFLIEINAKNLNLLSLSDIRIAQTHIIPAQGKSWTLNNKTTILSIVANRDALLLVKINNPLEISVLSNQYTVMIMNSNNHNNEIWRLYLNSPDKLPPTEDNGVKYSNEHYSVIIPKEFVKPGLKIQISSIILTSEIVDINVGQTINLKLWTLPIYLFGANDINTYPFNETKIIEKEVQDELIQKWSISDIDLQNHPIKRIDWPYLVLGPRNGYPAMKLTNSDQKKDTFQIMDGILRILGGIRDTFGEGSTPIQMYSPLLLLGSNGKFVTTGGGLGSIGGGRSTGDHLYKGIFIHEQGHAFSMPHAGEAFERGENPYSKGSLAGSEWGYDANHNEFLATFLPPSSSNFKNCNKTHLLDDKGRCIKQSVMQSGSGDQSSSYRFTMFQDFEMGTIQNYFSTRFSYDEQSGKYTKWNSKTSKYDDYTPNTQSKGLYSINEGVPIERDIDIYTIIFTYSTVGDSNLSQIYPLLKSKGNLIKYFDPTNKTEYSEITPNTSKYPWYCKASGCDYTIKVTYEDNSLKHVLIQQGKRQWFKPDLFKTGLMDSLSSDSFIVGTINVKGDKRIIKVELLDTPEGWNGISINATVLASKSF